MLDEIKKAQGEIQEKVTNEIYELKKSLKEDLDKELEQLKPDQEKISELEKKIAEIENANPVTKEDFEKLKSAVMAQGEQIKKDKKVSLRSGHDILKEFSEKYKELDPDRGEKASRELFRIKASEDTMSVNDVTSTVYPENGTTGIIGTLGSYYAQFIGFFRKKKPISRIMDVVDIIPLEQGKLYSLTEEEIGEAEFVPECGLKPVVKLKLEADEANAEAVAVFFKTTTKLRKFYSWVVNRFRQVFGQLITEKIPDAIINGDTGVNITGIKALASAYSPIPQLATHTDPNNYDVIGCVIAWLETLGYMPDAILLNPVAWANMKLQKGSDGHYVLANGESIRILESSIEWGGNRIEIIKDPTLGYDEFLIGDFQNAVKVGLDNDIVYREGYVDDDFRRNILSHIIERFVALLVPKGARTGLVSDTFSNVKTLITAS